MKKALVWAGAAVAVLLFTWGAVVAYRMWYDRKVPNFAGVQHVYVYPDMSPEEVEEGLLSSGKVKNASSFQRVFKEVSAVKPGHYLVDSTCTSMYVKRMLEKGWQTPVNLTLSGSIRREADLVRKIDAQMMVDSAQVAGFVGSNDSLARYGVKRPHLFTLIVPDTYQILWTASVPEIMDRLVEQRSAWWTEERKAAAQKQGLTPVEVSVLASIVDGETKYVPEQPAVAAVYLNRLRMGMKLQADPTVAYCFDYQLNRVLKSHLLVDSPYNTYKYVGLPPGPISCPPKSCLEAVLHPDSHNYLFFCADPAFNGTHRFASSYSEHLANARAFQRALTERQRGRK
ncbi:MAG: endolytic transglycosylase MltG [Bacteroidales bacterium]|nr:endolytic transglycosylase MltG [Bacteroidales bacterium]